MAKRHLDSIIGAVVLGLVLAFSGCGGSNCTLVCEKRRTCFTADLDVAECAKSCNERVNGDTTQRDKVAECADCYSGRTCAETLSSCIDDCWGV